MGGNGKGRRDGEKLVQERARKEEETKATKGQEAVEKATKGQEEVAGEKAAKAEKQEKTKAGPQEIKCEFSGVFCGHCCTFHKI